MLDIGGAFVVFYGWVAVEVSAADGAQGRHPIGGVRIDPNL